MRSLSVKVSLALACLIAADTALPASTTFWVHWKTPPQVIWPYYFFAYVGPQGLEVPVQPTLETKIFLTIPTGQCVYIRAMEAGYIAVAQSNEICPSKTPRRPAGVLVTWNPPWSSTRSQSH